MKPQHTVCDADLLALYLDQQLPEARAAELEQHLDHCQICRQQMERLAAAPDFWNGVQSRLQDQPSPSGLEVKQSAAARTDSSTRIATTQNPEADDPIVEERLSDSSAVQQYLVGWLAPTDDPNSIGRLAGYEIVGIVGIGGMSVVLKGFDRSLNRYVAIKVLGTHLAGSGAARKRFAREAQAAAAIVHENVLAIHTIEEFNGIPYLVMPYVRGESLEKRSQRVGPLQVVEVLRIGQQIAAGLSAAHDQGLVHRDIKPANILLDGGSERLKISDFGLARAAADASLTHSGSIAGTPMYMSPEQSRGEPVDQRSDIFSFGCLLYKLCTGFPPFRAETPYGIIRRICDDQARPIRESNPDVPAWLDGIIQQMMAKHVSDRFATARELDDLFKQGLAFLQKPPLDGQLPIALQRCAVWTGPAKPKAVPSPVKPLLIAAVVAVGSAIVLTLAVIGLIKFGQSSPPLAKKGDDVAKPVLPNSVTAGNGPVKVLPEPKPENRTTQPTIQTLASAAEVVYQFKQGDEVFYRVDLRVEQPDYVFKLEGLLELDVKAVEEGDGELGYRFSYLRSVHPTSGSNAELLVRFPQALEREYEMLSEMQTSGRLRVTANGTVQGRSGRCPLPGEVGLLNDWVFPAIKINRRAKKDAKQSWQSQSEFDANLFRAIGTASHASAKGFRGHPLGAFTTPHFGGVPRSIGQIPIPIAPPFQSVSPFLPDTGSNLNQRQPESTSVLFQRNIHFAFERTKQNADDKSLMRVDVLGQDQAASDLQAVVPNRVIDGYFEFDSERGLLESLALKRTIATDAKSSAFDNPKSDFSIRRVSETESKSYKSKLRERKKVR